MDNVYDLYDISRLTKLSVRTLRRMISNNLLEGDKTCGKWVFDINQIQSFYEKEESFPYISSKGRTRISEWLSSIHGTPDKCFTAFTFSNRDISQDSRVLAILLDQCCSDKIELHYGRYNNVMHIAYFGSIDAVNNAINELKEKCV